MVAPDVSLAGSSDALLVSWKASSFGDAKYELQLRENAGGSAWNTIAASLGATHVRKKNLTSKRGYQFRVRVAGEGSHAGPFSPPSEPFYSLGLSDGIKRLFGSLENGTLLKNLKDQPISLGEALGGKEFVLLYASAHWCGPCRQFTPNLASWYQSLGASRTVEVVFLSADREERGFQTYFSSMPWLAVEFDDPAREQLMGLLNVRGIPQLAVVDGRTGRVIEENSVRGPLDVTRWKQLAASKV
jgi:nucleoredoxin